MEKEEIKGLVAEATLSFDQFIPENPELTQAFMLKGIGYVLLAIFEILQSVSEVQDQATPASQHRE